MSNRYPELMFVAGPQAGTRTELTQSVAVAGRGATADVQIDEPYVSRRHVQWTYTTEGWVVENLSDNPVFINRKKYKKGVRIILETGDVLAIGEQTHILFVAQGDDPQAALDDWRAKHAPKPPEPEPEREPDVPEDREQDATLESDGAGQEEPQSRLMRFLPWIVVYMVLMVALVVFLVVYSGGNSTDPGTTGGPPRRLEAERIATLLSAEFEHGMNPDPDPWLAQAKALYYEKDNRKDALFMSVKYFKLYKANVKTHLFATTDDERLYEQALNELVDRVIEKYNNACVLSGARRWSEAQRLLEELDAMLPFWSEPRPETQNALYSNIRDHWKYVRRRHQRETKRR